VQLYRPSLQGKIGSIDVVLKSEDNGPFGNADVVTNDQSSTPIQDHTKVDDSVIANDDTPGGIHATPSVNAGMLSNLNVANASIPPQSEGMRWSLHDQ
jgi:hypothetical protein